MFFHGMFITMNAVGVVPSIGIWATVYDTDINTVSYLRTAAVSPYMTAVSSVMLTGAVVSPRVGTTLLDPDSQPLGTAPGFYNRDVGIRHV
jgi:hypothetical protein